MCCENNVNESIFVKYVLQSFDPQFIVLDVLGSYVSRMLARKVIKLRKTSTLRFALSCGEA